MSGKAWMRSLVVAGSMFGAVAPARAEEQPQPQPPPPTVPTVVVERVVVTDAAITQSIKAKLENSNVMRRSQVTIASAGGFVTLVGSVPDQFARDQILEATRATPGVVKIDDQLRFDISSPSAPARTQ
jgi:hypothetical protein